MKILMSCLLFLAIAIPGYGQKEFVGIAKYKMAMVGGPDEDSLQVVFDKYRILITLYLHGKDPREINEVNIIHDFEAKKIYTLNTTAKLFKADTLLNTTGFDFVDTKKIMLVKGAICFHYKADSAKIDRSKMQRADCLAAIDYPNNRIGTFWFMGYQPIIVDGKIVMDYIVTEPDGSKPRIYISEIGARKSVDDYFDLSGYRERK